MVKQFVMSFSSYIKVELFKFTGFNKKKGPGPRPGPGDIPELAGACGSGQTSGKGVETAHFESHLFA